MLPLPLLTYILLLYIFPDFSMPKSSYYLLSILCARHMLIFTVAL